MYTVFLCTIIGALIALYNTKRSKEKIRTIIGITLCSAFAGFFIGGFLAWCLGFAAPLEKRGWYTPIISLNNKTGTEGSFLRLDQETNYHYWYPDGKGHREGILDGDLHPLVVQEDRNDATLNWNKTHCDNWQFRDWVFCPIKSEDWTFYVPKGTIVEDYRLE